MMRHRDNVTYQMDDGRWWNGGLIVLGAAAREAWDRCEMYRAIFIYAETGELAPEPSSWPVR